MMAVCERAAKVMAALDRRVPSLDDFVGQSWTSWADWATVAPADGSDVDDYSKNGKKAAEAMSLSKEDMSIFGLYPGHDDFYLVVCSHCGQVVKPQAFEKHCERRHGPLAKLYARLRSSASAPQPQQRSAPQPQSQQRSAPQLQQKSAPQPQLQQRSAPQPQLQQRSAPQPQLQQRSAPQPQLQQRSAPQTQPQQRSTPQPQPQPQQRSAPQPQQRSASHPHPQQRSATQPQQRSAPQPQLQQRSAPQPQQRSAPQPHPQPRLAPQPQTQPQQRSHHGHSPSHGTTTSSSSMWETCRGQGATQTRTTPSSPSTPPQHRHSKNSKDGIRPSNQEKSSNSSLSEMGVFKPPPPLEPPISSPPPSLRDPPWPHGGTPPGRNSPADSRNLPQRKESTSPSAMSAHRVPRPYNKMASKRECDLDKHCGVLDPDRKKVCTRLLTCNIHSIHQRRKVVGRSRNFDQLVAELKTRVREKGIQALDGGPPVGRSPSPEAPREQAGAPHCRKPLASLPAFSRSTAPSESVSDEENQSKEEASPRAPSPITHGRISSDESDAEGPEEPADYSVSSSHPRPAAVCSFGSHALSHGIYTFDRRLHHLRSALSSMLEQHISAHLWKKIPQAADLHHPPPSTKNIFSSSHASIASAPSSSSSSLHSRIRTGSHISSSVKTSSVSSCGRSLDRNASSENANANAAHSASPTKFTSVRPASAGGQSKNPVGRPTKQMLRLREEAVTAATQRKRKAPAQEGEHSGPDRNCIPPPPAPPLPHAQTNGTLSPSGKPRHPPPSLESHSLPNKSLWTYKRTHPPLGRSSPPESAVTNSHSRAGGGDSGLHGPSSGRGLEHQGLLKKRKAGAMEEHLSSSKLSSHRTASTSSLSSSSGSGSGSSSSPRSNFYTWKDGKGGGLAGGVEKRLGTPKPKLHH
ncbi:ataxin-7-like protein 2a [Gouania willdenowi]|uniref:ataxin-7-like protein 2a n=1 Tax=Gouania willdenowi TaxID=441366 RepID=UPI00105530AA|nr:ataxin-7-like protein 2 [Gouania willdenowi]